MFVLNSYAWDESKHPRHEAGSSKGGKFAPKAGPGDGLSSNDIINHLFKGKDRPTESELLAGLRAKMPALGSLADHTLRAWSATAVSQVDVATWKSVPNESRVITPRGTLYFKGLSPNNFVRVGRKGEGELHAFHPRDVVLDEVANPQWSPHWGKKYITDAKGREL